MSTPLKVVVTGSRGKVGRAVVLALHEAGHEVVGSDRLPPVFERADEGAPTYVQADTTDAGDCYALLRHRPDAVVHCAAIPEPTQNPPHEVFANNLLSVFTLSEAAVRMGVRRFVQMSSETVPGFFFAERPFLPEYAPVDEEHPVAPQDPYALAKHLAEQVLDACVRRSDMACTSIRPSWVMHEGNYAQNLGPQVRDAAVLSPNLWSYIDVYDLADATRLAVETDLPGHEVFYVASPDNAGGHDFAAVLRQYYGDRIALRELERPDASGISCAKARRMLGWTPTRSWRDYLDADGQLLERWRSGGPVAGRLDDATTQPVSSGGAR
ncbi:MAG: nucleoside-diphosphate-sugar epimerase [Frankiales bacterium]|nr:nucleoside-diphosphate-sugar epimerase [Frankiales bacterium]